MFGGMDPVYLMVFLTSGLIVVVAVMLAMMLWMVIILRGIKNATVDTNGHLKAVHAARTLPGAAESGTVHLSPRIN